MALIRVVIVALMGVAVQYVSAQWGLGANVWNQNRYQPPPAVYATCIGKNTLGDEIRITIQPKEQTQQGNWFARPAFGLHMHAYVKIGQNSDTVGNFQLLLTTYSRVEDGCTTEAFGDIVSSNNNAGAWWGWWGQNQNTENGRLGSSFVLNRMSPGYISESDIEGINRLTEIYGRGILLCPANAVYGGKCNVPAVRVCAKCSRDTLNATSIMRTSAMGTQNAMGGMNGMQSGGMGAMQNGGMGVMQNGGMQNGALGGMQNGAMGATLPGGSQMGDGTGVAGNTLPLVGLKKKK